MTSKRVAKPKIKAKVATAEVIVDTPTIIEETEPMKTYVSIVLDRSGSMGVGWADTLSMLRQQITLAKEQVSENHQVFISVSFFNNVVLQGQFVNAAEASPHSWDHLYPSGGTALYDAMMLAIHQLKAHMMTAGPKDAALMVTITDGEENSSSTYRSPFFIKKEIEELTSTGKFTFTYVGTEDAFKVNQSFGINSGNTIVYTTAKGIGGSAFTASAGYYGLRNTGSTMATNFFKEKEELTKNANNPDLTSLAQKITGNSVP